MPKWVDEALVDTLMDIIDPDPEADPVRRLVIDDVRVFDFEVTRYARNPQDAMIAIRDDGPWDEVFWDHD